MKIIILFIIFSNITFANQLEFDFEQLPCMSKEIAREKLKSLALDNLTICEGHYDNTIKCIEESKIDSLAFSIRWSKSKQLFTSSTIYEWYCAMGAQCWSGFTLDCKGELGVWNNGES